MALQRWDPFNDMLSLRDAMNRLFEDSVVRTPSLAAGGTIGMPVDVEETDDDYTVKATLPGFKPEEINVSLTGDTLTISAQHQGEEERKGTNYLVRERRMGSYSRTIALPKSVQSDQAQANYENGELILTIPKAEETKPKQLEINVGGGQKQLEGTVTSQH